LHARYRLDLADEWRGRRWRRLLNLIDHLPRNSRLHEAMAEDERLAEHLLSQPEPKEAPPTRRWSEFSIEVELLAGIFDRLADVPNAIAAANGAKPRKVKPYPRPITAVERVRERKAKTKHRSVVARVLPRGGTDPAAFVRAAEQSEKPPPARRRRSKRAEPGRPLFPDQPPPE
jgi:hypothetical protein